MLSEFAAGATAYVAQGDFDNPLEGESPSFEFLSGEFNVMSIILIIWAMCFLGAILYLAKGLLQYAAAKQQGMVERVGESAREVKNALIGVGGLVALPAIVTLIITIMNSL